MRRWIVAIAIFIAVPFTLGKQATTQTIRPDWDQAGRPWAAMIRSAALSTDGRCAAITTTSFVAVIDKTGNELWRWNFSEGNRYIAASKVAVAPKCDWLVFVGGPGYHYSWFVHRNGKRVPVKSEGTPLGVEINHQGTLAVIGTGAGIVYLYSADGSLRWKNDVLSGYPLDELSFAADDSAVMVRSWVQSVISIDGKTRWTGAIWGVGSGRASRDFRRFVAWGEPPHGPGIGRIGLINEAGKIVWERYANYPSAIISNAGDYVIAQTNDNQNPTEEDGFSPRKEQLTWALRLISADGAVVRTYSIKGDPIAFASDGRRFLIRATTGLHALDLEGTPLWTVPAPEVGDVRVLSTADLRTLVVLENGNLSWYSPK